MKLLYITAVLCFLVASAAADEFIGFYKDPAHPGKCVVDGKILSPGDVAQYSADCYQMICGEQSRVKFLGCAVQGVDPGYKLGEPKGPNYPDCCEREYIPI